MWIYEPSKFAASTEKSLLEGGFMDAQKARIELATGNVPLIPSATVIAAALEVISEESGINLTSDDLRKMLSLYPMQRGMLAGYGINHSEVREMMLDVVANFVANTRWPRYSDGVVMQDFTKNLKSAARFLGFKTVSV